MDKNSMKLRDKLSVYYRGGVFQFITVAKYHVDEYRRIRCPCKRCIHSTLDSLESIERHLLTNGICPSYTF